MPLGSLVDQLSSGGALLGVLARLPPNTNSRIPAGPSHANPWHSGHSHGGHTLMLLPQRQAHLLCLCLRDLEQKPPLPGHSWDVADHDKRLQKSLGLNREESLGGEQFTG